MKEIITGKNIRKDMRKIAKDYLTEYRAGCVCLAIDSRALHINSKTRRSINGGEHTCYVGVSGNAGRNLLRRTFNESNIDNRNNWTREQVTTLLQTVASNLVVYNSKKVGKAILQQEAWTTHNCAESNLALYLYKQGKQLQALYYSVI